MTFTVFALAALNNCDICHICFGASAFHRLIAYADLIGDGAVGFIRGLGNGLCGARRSSDIRRAAIARGIRRCSALRAFEPRDRRPTRATAALLFAKLDV